MEKLKAGFFCVSGNGTSLHLTRWEPSTHYTTIRATEPDDPDFADYDVIMHLADSDRITMIAALYGIQHGAPGWREQLAKALLDDMGEG